MNLNEQIESLKQDLVSAVQGCIQIKSVKNMEESTQNAPFGKGIKECLDWTLELGKQLGFKVKNVDGYAGQIEMGTGELVGILGHLDVVPEGDGWTFPPYGGEIHNGKIYGRGALDDKGPSLAALFAMKVILDSGLPLKKRVRLILGTDEESGWADMDYYLEKEEIPAIGFAPDAEFPVIHAEKGIIHIKFSKPYIGFTHILHILGGERPNVVPNICRIAVQGIDEATIHNAIASFPHPEEVMFKIEKQDTNTVEVTVRGKSAHGSLPDQGINAVIYGLRFLKILPLNQVETEFIDWILKYPGEGFHGEGFNIAYSDEPSGKLSLNIGIIRLEKNEFDITIDVRYPVTYNREDVLNPIEKNADQYGFKIEITNEQGTHYVPKDSPLVQSILKAYGDVTGLEPYAFAIGGGTYAKVMPQGVAFGPTFPGEPELIHCPDECISIDNLILTTKIYAQAILNLIS